MKTAHWIRSLAALAGLKLLLAVVGALWGPEAEAAQSGGATLLPRLVLLLPFFAFAAGGVLFLVGGRGDDRAADLGTCFLLVATSFSNRHLLRLVEAEREVLSGWALGLSSLALDAFLPYLFWRFTTEFPSVAVALRWRRIAIAGRTVSLVIGFGLFAGELVKFLVHLFGHVDRPGVTLADLAPQKPSYPFYSWVLALTAAAILMLLARARAAADLESRRIRLFVFGLTGMVPFFVLIVLEYLILPLRSVTKSASGFPVYAVLFLLFSSVPFTSAYAVLVHQVLNVRLIARKALRYALARYSVMALAAVPLIALGIYVYNHRMQSIQELFSGIQALLLLSAFVVGAAALRHRATLLDGIDRRFFREQYDARQILTRLVERIRAVREVAGLASLICREVDLALHLEGIALLALDARSGVLVDPRHRARRLDGSSRLALLVASASDPLLVDLENPRSPLARLQEKERHWLVDNGFKLLVPILARDGSLLGLIGLGEKKSGLPFLKEDRQLLHFIASSSAWVLEFEHSQSLTPTPRRRPWRDAAALAPATAAEEVAAVEFAKECTACGLLHSSYTVFCSACSHRLEPAPLPYVMPGKFRFERRLGTGGMGVVYRGFDLGLGRPVAVKTLRRVSPEDAMRLRREARTAAAVAHVHLAAVYGMETWQGTPMLILELLEGGTLSQRIEAQGRLSPLETVELGIAMADALAVLHAADILHRDLKPSNIGYAKDGTPKLMDFGIAQAMFDLRRDTDSTPAGELEESSSILPPTSLWHQSSSSPAVSKQLVGTLSYLSPEAASGRPPDASFDLWGLAIVLYECLLGRKVFVGADVRQVMNRIRMGRVPDFSQVLPEYEDALGEFFRSSLHRNVSRRPASAQEFKRRLESVRLHLAPRTVRLSR